VRIEQVWLDGQEYSKFDPKELTVRLPDTQEQVRVKVRLTPEK
jgi:hypothetical protein